MDSPCVEWFISSLEQSVTMDFKMDSELNSVSQNSPVTLVEIQLWATIDQDDKTPIDQIVKTPAASFVLAVHRSCMGLPVPKISSSWFFWAWLLPATFPAGRAL